MHHRYLNSTTPCTFTVRVSGRYERRQHPRRRKAQSRCVERAQEGKPWVSRSRLVTPVANPKVSIQGWRWGVESRVEGAHSSLRHELRALSALRTHMRAHTHTHRHKDTHYPYTHAPNLSLTRRARSQSFGNYIIVLK